MDSFVDSLLAYAVVNEVRALDAVEQAKTELETFITSVSITEIGKDSWIAGKKAREAAVTVARTQLKETPAPAPFSKKRGTLMTYEQALPSLERGSNARFIDRILVKPVGRGHHVPVNERVEVYWSEARTHTTWPRSTLQSPISPRRRWRHEGRRGRPS